MDYYYYCNGEKLLIGHDYSGWAFFICVDEVPNLIEWKKKFQHPNAYIKTGSGYITSLEEMEVMITLRSGNIDNSNMRIREYGSNVFEGIHNLVHIRTGCCVGTMKCVENGDCWDLFKNTY